MRRRSCLQLAAALAVALGLLAPGARADELTDDDLLFAQERSILRLADGVDQPREVVRLRLPAALVTRIRTAVDGSAALLDIAGETAWVDLGGDAPARPRYLPCSTPAHLSADGDRVLCGAPDGARTALYRLRPTLSHQFLEVAPTELRFAGDAEDAIITTDDDTIARTDVASGARQVLSPHRPDRDLLVAPSGQRAVGTYLDTEIPTLYSFRLDGRAARRKLMAGAEPLAFSRDSRWIILQSGKRACVVRVVGGEYKCWKGYRAVAPSTHARALLLSRPSSAEGRIDLYRAPLGGARSKPPRLLLEAVLPAVAFVAPPPAPPAEGDAATP